MSSNPGQAAQQLAQELLRSAGGQAPIAARLLAQALARLEQAELRQAVLEALKGADDPPSMDALWAVWAETRQPELGALLAKRGKPAARPAALHILSQLALGQSQALADSGPEAVETLLEAADDPDPGIAQAARQALENLANPAAQEAVCRWVIEHDHGAARQAAVQAGYAPRDVQRRALFFLLSEQWERYESLDFDASLLRAVHQAAGADLRRKIAGLARRAGWAGYLEALAGERSTRRMEELNSAEWEVILALLGRHERWEEAWQLAQAAPPVWSARLLHEIRAAGWVPPGAEAGPEFQALAQMAAECLAQGLPFDLLPRQLTPLSSMQPAPKQRPAAYRPPPATVMAFHPSGEMLACGSADRSVSLWDTRSGELLTRLEGHGGVIVSLAFSPDGEVLASGSADRTLRLWPLESQAAAQILGGYGGEVAALAFSRDGKLLASGDPVAVWVWETPSGKMRHLMPFDEGGMISLAFSPDEALLGSSHTGNALRLWDMASGETLGALMERVSCWAFSPVKYAGGAAQDCILVTGSTYGQARVWQTPPANLVKTLEGRIDGGQMAISPDGKILAASERKRIRLWNLPGGEALGTLEEHPQHIRALAFSADGATLASGGGDLRLWQIAQGRLIQAVGGFSGEIKQILFSPDSRCLACLDGEKPHLLGLDNPGSVVRTPSGEISAQAAAQEMLQRATDNGNLAPRERAWLDFTLQLHTRRSRFDIEIEEGRPPIAIGDFDIEISA